MSLQNESFPDDAFLDDELELSSLSNGQRRFEFPHHHREKILHKPTASVTNTSSSSATSSSDQNDQNLSSESVNGRPSSVLSSKTTASDPAGMADHKSKKSDFDENGQSKAVSYQDIHSEYTKRRYKHVESKVGKYIATMKAEDEKRRQTAKFIRYSSMPETLSETKAITEMMTHFSTTNVRPLVESMACNVYSSEGMACTTSGLVSSDDTGASVYCIDRASYVNLVNEKERIQSYSDYLQTKLDDKMAENMRLQRNLDFMRIELGNAKDKLKKQQSVKGMNLGMGAYASSCTALGATRYSLQSLLRSQEQCSKATQTDAVVMPPTPTPSLAPDANNNTGYDSEGFNKSGTTIQLGLSVSCNSIEGLDDDDGHGHRSDKAVMRQCSVNSNASPSLKAQKITLPQRGNNAIESHAFAEVEGRSISNRFRLRDMLSLSRRRSHVERREEFAYYNNHTEHYAVLETLNASNSSSDERNENIELTTVTVAATASSTSTGRGQKTMCVSASTSASTTTTSASTSASKLQTNSLRRRWLRLFAPCTRCKDPNQTIDLNYTEQRCTLLDPNYENQQRNQR